MSIIKDFLNIIKDINEVVQIPPIKEIFIPTSEILIKSPKKSSFGAVQLEDKTIGIVFLNLNDKIKEESKSFDLNTFKGTNTIDLALKFSSSNDFYKTLGLGAMNAISQYILRKPGFSFDFTTDPLGKLYLNNQDNVGMVGFFPPLVNLINKMEIPLIVIEKKEQLVQQHENWQVTLDASALERCNKVLCTSTTVLNNTLDDILSHCKSADRIAVVGPTAGFLPDPLFKKNVQVVGGTFIQDPMLFMQRIKKGIKWGDSAEKYCIEDITYPGYKHLLKTIS